MTHQLHLDDVNLALIVFDARTDGDIFGGVKHWARALRVAERLRSQHAPPLKKFLVAARADRGGPGVSQERIQAISKELKLDGYFETSAKESWQIRELRSAIQAAIDWESLPPAIWQPFFLKAKDFILTEKKGGRLLCLEDELLKRFAGASNDQGKADSVGQFNTCVDRLANQDLIRRLHFGGLVLLKPEVLDAYASAIVLAALDEPDGTGSIAESDLFAGRFKMSKDERLKDKRDEQLLLLATAEELLEHEIALRETSEDGTYFIFPSQLTRERPSSSPQKLTKSAILEFKGPLQHIYATLAVRLSHCGFFVKDQMWRNAANFRARDGGLCGVYVREIEEGYGELIVFFEEAVTAPSRYVFQEYVHSHLVRRSVPGSVTHRFVIRCGQCSFAVTDQLVALRRERGFDWVGCPVCEQRVSLEPQEHNSAPAIEQVTALDRQADLAREKVVNAVIVESKKKISEFDVFLAYKTADKPHIVKLADLLRERSLNPWLDKEQIPPGRWFQDVIQAAIPKVKAAAICIGTSGLGRWQTLELRAFIGECVETQIPVIPVLLPGVADVPGDLRFLKEMSHVRFIRSLEETSALDDLVWAITGKRP
jgi:hypothetical protein